MTPIPFHEWVIDHLGVTPEQVETIKLQPCLDVFLSRMEAARRRGATDPLVTVTAKRAGGNSRDVTKRMLSQLGYTPSRRRAIHRLLAGSPSGWPGLLRLYVDAASLTPAQRMYARAQVRAILTTATPAAAPAARPTPGAR